MEKSHFAHFRLVRPHDLWEQHRESVKLSVRVLDDFLECGQNESVGDFSPTDQQSWIRSRAPCECSEKPSATT